jgi:ribosomal protein L16/L10AE
LVLFNKCQYIICVPVGGAFFTFKQMKKVSKAKQAFKFTNSKLSVKYRINISMKS